MPACPTPTPPDHRRSRRPPAALLAAALFGLLIAPPGRAGEVSDRVHAAQRVRVCIWPDYHGISWRNPRSGQLSGLDIDLSAAFAADLGVAIEYVDSSFSTLIADLRADRCDIAMYAIAVLPSRAQQLAFTRPYVRSDIHAITTRSHRRIRRWADIDQAGVQVAVQAGTFIETAMAAQLKRARLVVVRPPQTREQELEAGRVDVFITDYPYSRRLLDSADWARLISPPLPLHPTPCAYAVKPGDATWLATADAFVTRIHRDGRLDRAALRHRLTAIVER